MEDLLRSLRGLGLRPPNPSQLLELHDDDKEAQRRLAQQLSFETIDEGDGDSNGDSEDVPGGSASALMGADILEGAVHVILENYHRTLERERSLWKREMSSLTSPKPYKKVPVRALLTRQKADIERSKRDYSASVGYRPRLVFDGGPSYSSSTPLERLQRIAVHELLAPKHHEGRYLLCRVITPLNLYVGATFMVEDPAGDGIPVSVSHFVPSPNLSLTQLSRLLPLGTQLAIREPYVSLHHAARSGPIAGKGATGVRVDTPTDIVVLQSPERGAYGRWARQVVENVQWSTTLEADKTLDEEYDKKGAVLGCDGALCDAGVWLQEGPLSQILSERMAASEEEPHAFVPTVKDAANGICSRILALLRAGRYGAAQRELHAARKLGVFSTTNAPENEYGADALEARVYYALGAFEESAKAASLALNASSLPVPCTENVTEAQYAYYPSLTDIDLGTLYLLAKQRSTEQKSGPSALRTQSLYYSAQSPSCATPRLDSADYVGPVEVQEVAGAGRGLVITRDVEPGELLLCCRAIGSTYPDDNGCAGTPIMRFNLENGVVATTSQVLAATRVIHMLVDRPELALPFLGLTAGPSMLPSKWTQQPYQLCVDPLSFSNNSLSSALANGNGAPVDIDAAYVDGVLRFNAFGPSRTPGAAAAAAAATSDASVVTDTGELARSTMPHPLPAILNHACIPNVSSIFLGDVVTTRALHALPRGTEIVHQYVRGEQPYALRRAQLSKHGFLCCCKLCKLDIVDGDECLLSRQRIVGGTAAAVFERSRMLRKQPFQLATVSQDTAAIENAHADVVQALRDLIHDIEQTYAPNRGPLKPELFELWHAIAEHAALHCKSVDSAIDAELAALRCVGAIPTLEWQGVQSKIIHVENDSDTIQPIRYTLKQLPELHFDPALRSMLFIATILAQKGHTTASLCWTTTAYWAHECMISGGLAVFEERCAAPQFDAAFRLWAQHQRNIKV